MQTGKPIVLHGMPVAQGKFPLVCTPLVGRTRQEISDEVQRIVAKKPDVLEWRVDFFAEIADQAVVLSMLQAIRQAAPDTGLLFTRRARREGGQAIALSEATVLRLYQAVCESGLVDLVDFEMNNDPAHVAALRAMSRANDVQLILSFHDFSSTPTLALLNQRFLQAQQLGADIAKVAVMPHSMEDVLTLLTATLQSSAKLNIPLISMSMQGQGSLTRLCGWAFGSAMTFAVGAGSSAPGQVALEDLTTALEILRKAMHA